jgi:hypothetical protein
MLVCRKFWRLGNAYYCLLQCWQYATILLFGSACVAQGGLAHAEKLVCARSSSALAVAADFLSLSLKKHTATAPFQRDLEGKDLPPPQNG